MAIVLTEKNFDKEVLNSNVPVLLDFWASWCLPCRMFGPTVEKLSQEVGTKAKVGKINVDEQPKLTAKYDVKGIPTVLIVKNGKITARETGFKTRAHLKKLLGIT